MVQQGLEEADAAIDTPQFTARDPRSPPHGHNDVWDLIYSADLLQRLTTTGKKDTPKPSAPPPPREQNWRLLNISAGGYCLLSDRARSARAQVGDPIALEAGETQHRWQLGVVRWLRLTACISACRYSARTRWSC
jgi:hypothetical protein